MFKWIHHLLEPHCPECRLEKECPSCETLRMQLAQSNEEKDKLLEIILERNKPVKESVPVATQPLRPLGMPWKVRQQLLENEDRQKACILREQKITPETTTEELEKELNIAESSRAKEGN